jgi:hypothetical protein
MSINPFEISYQPTPIRHEGSSTDGALLGAAEKKIGVLQNFVITGNLVTDYNNFLKITNRDVHYKIATDDSEEDLLKNLESIQASLIESHDEKINDVNESPASERFYVDLPREELAVISDIINRYKDRDDK